MYGDVPTRTHFVGSQSTIAALVQHYVTALEGKTYICQGLSGCGKTTSALYLTHGDFNIRPRRAIMIRASDSKDLAASFSSSLGAPDAAPIISEIVWRNSGWTRWIVEFLRLLTFKSPTWVQQNRCLEDGLQCRQSKEETLP